MSVDLKELAGYFDEGGYGPQAKTLRALAASWKDTIPSRVVPRFTTNPENQIQPSPIQKGVRRYSLEEMVNTPFHFDPVMHKLPEDLPEQFVPWLEAFRERLGISRAMLARRSGISSSYLHLLIKGKRTNVRQFWVSNMATALFLNESEREHLLNLAGHPDKSPT